MNWQSLTYKRLSRPEVNVANSLLSAVAGRIECSVKGQLYHIHMTAHSGDYNAVAVLHCCIDGSTVSVYLNAVAMDALLEGIVPFSSIQSLPDDLQLALLLAAVVPLAEVLKDQWGVAITIERFEALSDEVTNSGLLFEIISVGTDAAQTILVMIERALPASFIKRLCRTASVPPAKDCAWLTVPVRLEAGAASLSLSEIKLIQQGDIILLSTSYLSDGHLRVSINSYFSCLAQIDGNSLIVQTQPEKIMEEEPKTTDDAEQKSQPALDTSDLPVNVLFVAGHLTLTLKELQQVSPGYVFDLNKDAGQEIEILVNGSRIGNGELVEVDGRVGVRVLECK